MTLNNSVVNSNLAKNNFSFPLNLLTRLLRIFQATGKAYIIHSNIFIIVMIRVVLICKDE